MLELLTARQSCSERVVIIRIVRVDGSAGPAGPQGRSERCDGVMGS